MSSWLLLLLLLSFFKLGGVGNINCTVDGVISEGVEARWINLEDGVALGLGLGLGVDAEGDLFQKSK